MNIVTRPLSSDEIVRLVTHARQPWKSIFFLSGYTGLRISDLIMLPWIPRPTMGQIIERKTQKPRELIWSDLASAYWHDLYCFGSPRKYLFPARDISTYRKALISHCNKLNISTYRIAFHSFRKTHAILAYRENGILAAKAAMNHSSIIQTEKYVTEALKLDSHASFDRLFVRGGQND